MTRCSSEQEFINRFARFATETDIAVPALPDVSVGTERHFAIRLKDGSVVMRGRCEVTEVRPVAVAPGAAPTSSGLALMRLRLREMDAHSAGIHLRLMERHASAARAAELLPDVPAAPVEPPVSASTTTDVSEVTVVGGAASPADTETTAVSPLPGSETRAPGAAFTLPANPLSDLDAADLASFIELTLHESDAQPPSARAARFRVRLDGARRSARRAAPYASCLIGGIVLGFALRSGTTAAPVAAAPNLAPPSLPAATAPPSTAEAPEDEPPIFAEVTPPTTTERGQGAAAAQRLQRQSAKVAVTSSPSNAFIKVNKHRMGRTPRDITAPRFQRVRIEASLPGYQPWKKTVYLEEAESQVDIKLVRRPAVAAR